MHTKGTHAKKWSLSQFLTKFWLFVPYVCTYLFFHFCSRRIGITIRCVKYFAFRRIASKLMKLWYKTWDHWSFFCGFFHQNFHQKNEWSITSGKFFLKFSKKMLNPLGETNFDISNFRLCAFCVHIIFLKIYFFYTNHTTALLSFRKFFTNLSLMVAKIRGVTTVAFWVARYGDSL